MPTDNLPAEPNDDQLLQIEHDGVIDHWGGDAIAMADVPDGELLRVARRAVWRNGRDSVLTPTDNSTSHAISTALAAGARSRTIELLAFGMAGRQYGPDYWTELTDEGRDGWRQEANIMLGILDIINRGHATAPVTAPTEQTQVHQEGVEE